MMPIPELRPDVPESVPGTRGWRGCLWVLVQTLILSLALVIAIISLEEVRHVQRQSVEISNNPTKVEAEEILASANEAVEYSNRVLSFVQAASVIVSVLAVGIGVLVRLSVQQELETLDKFKRDTTQDADAFRARATDYLNQVVEQIRTEIVPALNDYVQTEAEKTRATLTNFENIFTERERWLVELEQSLRQEVRSMRQEMDADMQKALSVLRLQLLAEQQVHSYNFDAAIDTLDQAYDIDTDDHVTNYLLGYLYSRKDIDRAKTYLEHALKIEPGFIPGIAALGLVLRRKGDKITDPALIKERDRLWKEAKSMLSDALDKVPRLTDADGESYFGSLGGLYRRQERYHAAVDAYEQARKVTPDSSYPVINLASLYKYLGQDKQADDCFREVVTRAELTLDDNPRDIWTRADHAQALLVLGETDRAMREIEWILQMNPDPGILETVLDGLRFLSNAPTPIPNLSDMIAELETAHDNLRAAEQALREAGGDD